MRWWAKSDYPQSPESTSVCPLFVLPSQQIGSLEVIWNWIRGLFGNLTSHYPGKLSQPKYCVCLHTAFKIHVSRHSSASQNFQKGWSNYIVRSLLNATLFFLNIVQNKLSTNYYVSSYIFSCLSVKDRWQRHKGFILTQFYQKPTGTVLNWPSTTKYKPVPPYADPIPASTNQPPSPNIKTSHP